MKKNKEVSVNRFIIPLLFIFFSVLLEIVNFLWLGFKTSSGAIQFFPSAWLFNISVILIIAGIIYLVGNKYAMLTIFYIFIFIQILLNIVNASMFNVFGDIFTFDYILLGEETVAAIRAEFIDFWAIGVYLGIFAVIITVTVLLYKKNKKTISLRVVSSWIFALGLVLLSESLGVGLFAIQYKQIVSADTETIEGNSNYLWNSFQFKLEAYQEFGFYGFYCKNIYDYIKPRPALSKEEKDELLAYIEAGKQEDVHGALENDNLIVLLCESHEWFAYDPYNTPFIWNLMTAGEGADDNGIDVDAQVFNNFYGHNKTNVSEGIVISGNMPKEKNIQTLVGKYEYDYAYTLPKLFKKAHANEDIQVNYFHTYEESFYQRNKDYFDEGYGFDEFYSMNDLEDHCKWFGDWVSDADFITTFADEFVPTDPNKKFMSFFATMSTHGPYVYENPRYTAYYEEYEANYINFENWFKEYYPDLIIPTNKKDYGEFRHYKAAAMDFDRAVENIFKELQKKNHLEDTTVVLFADHNAFYDNFTYKIKGISKSDYSNIEAHRIPLIIYNSKLEGKTYDEFCNTYDIFPTICDLHGFEYNTNLVQGHDLLTEDIKNSFFSSHSGGMFTDKFYSKNISDRVPVVDNLSDVDVDFFRSLAEQFYQRQEKLEKIYLYNLAK